MVAESLNGRGIRARNVPLAAATVSSSAMCQTKISELPWDRMEHVASVLPSGERPIGVNLPACPSSVTRVRYASSG